MCDALCASSRRKCVLIQCCRCFHDTSCYGLNHQLPHNVPTTMPPLVWKGMPSNWELRNRTRPPDCVLQWQLPSNCARVGDPPVEPGFNHRKTICPTRPEPCASNPILPGPKANFPRDINCDSQELPETCHNLSS